jgi:hypothetical protein
VTGVRLFWCHGITVGAALARGTGGANHGGDPFLSRLSSLNAPLDLLHAARSTSRCSDLLIVGPSLRFTVLGKIVRRVPPTLC